MRVLVTGCAGFIGSHLAEQLLVDGHEVLGVDCFTDYYDRSIKEANIGQLRMKPGFTLYELDLAVADLDGLVEGVDIVYHQAAQPGVRASWGQQFQTYVRDNILATQRLLEVCRNKPLTKFVYASSSSIYGNAETFPTNEAVTPSPVSPYGATKLAGEHLAHVYWRTGGVPTVSLRYFSVYGPRQRPDMAFHRFIQWALDGEPIRVFGDGRQTRDFTYVSDVVAANLAAANSRVVAMPINIGGGSRVSLIDVIGLLGELLGRRLEVEYLPVEDGDVRDTSADTYTAGRLLGFQPRTDLRRGLAAEIDWLRAQREHAAALVTGVATTAADWAI